MYRDRTDCVETTDDSKAKNSLHTILGIRDENLPSINLPEKYFLVEAHDEPPIGLGENKLHDLKKLKFYKIASSDDPKGMLPEFKERYFYYKPDVDETLKISRSTIQSSNKKYEDIDIWIPPSKTCGIKVSKKQMLQNPIDKMKRSTCFYDLQYLKNSWQILK